jgi:hypothetical protein
METPFDWITLTIFSGLIVLFIDRSTKDRYDDHLWQYLVAAVGCAVANYLGNEGQPVAGALMVVAVIGYIVWVLKPIPGWPRR